MYKVVRNCGWGNKSWVKGGTIRDGDVPPEVIDVLLNRTKAIVPEPDKQAKPVEKSK